MHAYYLWVIADRNDLLQDGKSPLVVACEKGHAKISQLLIDKGADVNRWNVRVCHKLIKLVKSRFKCVHACM